MTDETETNDRWDLLGRLLTEALSHIDARTPIAIAFHDNVPPPLSEQATWKQYDQPQAADEIGKIVNQSLALGPVLLLPPWKRLTEHAPQPAGIAVRNAHEAVLAVCRPDGADSILVAIVPASTLASASTSHLRVAIGQYWHTAAVVYTTNVLQHIHHSFELAVVILRSRAAAKQPSTRIFRVPVRADASAVEAEYRRLWKAQGGRSTYGYVLRDAPAPGDSLAFDRHDPKAMQLRNSLTGFGKTVPLDELCEVRGGAASPLLDRNLFCTADEPGAARLLDGRDVGRNGLLAPPTEDAPSPSRWARIPADRQLQSGDLVMRSLYRRTDPGGLVVAEITADDLPAAATPHVIVLRPRVPPDSTRVYLLKLFLCSPLARALANQVTNAMNGYDRLTPQALATLPVPQPDTALKTALADLAEAARRLESWRSDALALVESAFLDEPRVSRARLLESGRTLRMRAEAAALLDDFDHTVRTRYPYPIAYRWRGLEAEIDGDSPELAYEMTLEAAEVLLCYVAHLGMVMSRHAGIEIPAVNVLRERLAGGRSGPGLGDWISILNELSGRRFRNLPDDQPLGEVRRMLSDNNEAVTSAVKRIADRRNDHAHLRRGDTSSSRKEALGDLRTLLRSAEFLCDLRLIHVTRIRWDSIRRTATLRYREMMGDHSIVPTRSMQYSSNEIEEGSLYIIDSLGGLHLVRPFLIGQPCAECAQWSTFHVDRVPRTGDVILKSLEHGHTVSVGNLREPLQHVGLL